VDRPTRPRPEREALWASASRAAAAVARREASTEADVLRAVTEEFRQLRLTGAVSLIGPDGQMTIGNRPLSPSLERTLERLTGAPIAGYRFDPQRVDIYRQALTSGQAVFSPQRSTAVAQLVPRGLRGLVPRILYLLGDMPLIVAPLALAGETLGALNVTGAWLTPDDLPMVEALADHVAVALGHARGRAATQAALERERLRSLVAETVASDLDLPQVLERILRLAADLSGADAGAIGLLDDDQQVLHYPHLIGLPHALSLHPLARGEGIGWQALEARAPLRLESYRRHPAAPAEWLRAGLHAALSVPLATGDRLIGALDLFTLDRDHTFAPEHVDLIQAIAHMAALAIRNSHSMTEARRRAAESQALMQSASAISSSLDLQTVLTAIAERARALFHADGSRIHLYDPERQVLRCLVALQPDAEHVMRIELRRGQGLTGTVLESGQPLLVNDAATDPRSLQVPGTPEDDPEVMALVPLRIRQRSMGVMTVLRFSCEKPFTESDLELLTAFAAHAAVALENAHLYGQIEQQAQRLEAQVVERTRALALSEARYRSLVETSLAGIFQTDLEGRVVYINQAFLDLFQRSASETLNRSALEIEGIAPDYRHMVNERFLARLRGERPPREVYEIELQLPDGQRVPALLASSLIADAEGQPQGSTGLVLDISARKELEAALQAERDRLHAILANIGDAVMVTGSGGHIQYVNPAWEQLNGYAADEAVGQTPRLIRSGQHPPELYAELWRTVNAGQVWHGELINRRKDGSLYDAAVTIAPVRDEAGHIVSFVGVQHDISALKELDRMKSQFVSDVSHELRTPLTNIRLYLDLLASQPADERSAGYLRTMDRESSRLAHLIDDLLSLSRLDAGTAAFYPAPCDLNELLRALVDDRRALASKRGLTLDLACDPALPAVLGDERLLTQVFTNLLTNALNYTPSGGLVTLRTRRAQEGGRGCAVADVEDTGLGITRDEQKEIFRRFFRGKASRETNAAGTGLGLAICREILERHGGRIEVASTGIPGQGSRFTVWLPAAPA
jgi:PAS domain S-box-containing protein